MWYCNGDLDTDCCLRFETPDVWVNRRGKVTFTCPFCGAIAEPLTDADRAWAQAVIEKYSD